MVNIRQTGRLELIFVLFVIPVGALLASPISTNDLFLAPSSIVTDDYTAGPTFNTTIGRTFRTNLDALSLNFAPGSLLDLPSGSTITGAHILPLLIPNPTTVQGEYSFAALAGINVGNYSTYFFRRPGTDAGADYWADLEAGKLAINFNATGQYFLSIDYLLGGVSSSTTYYHVEVNDFFGGDGAADLAGVARTMNGPTTDFNVVSTTQKSDNEYAVNAAKELTNRLGADRVARANTLQEACDKIKDASEKAGKKISVSLVGHGYGGSIRIGTERINSDGTGAMTPEMFQKCVDPYVSRIEFWGCSVGLGDAGEQFRKDFKKSIDSVRVFPVPLTAFPTGWDVVAGGSLGSDVPVPEPATILLLFIGLFAATRRSQ